MQEFLRKFFLGSYNHQAFRPPNLFDDLTKNRNYKIFSLAISVHEYFGGEDMLILTKGRLFSGLFIGPFCPSLDLIIIFLKRLLNGQSLRQHLQ